MNSGHSLSARFFAASLKAFALLVLFCGVFFVKEKLFSGADDPLGRESHGDIQKSVPEVAGVSDEKDTFSPISFESRDHAAEFRPIRKEGVYDLALPSAHASVVMDAESGIVLQEKNSHEERQIASLTKLMTAILVVEHTQNLDEPVKIDEEMIAVEGTRIGCPRTGFCNGVRLHVGEEISVRSLLMAMLMNSANDAAQSLAKHTAGSVDAFVELMNARARALGLLDTHFCTPSGLEPDGRESSCYSSAFDIARIASQALKYDIIWELARTPGTTIISSDGRYSHDIFNTDVLLGEDSHLIGTKTGFTPLAGYSLLAISFDPDRQHKVVSVVLNDPERWTSIKKMFSWAFQSHYWR
ncbi:MAG: D-alanyl-D-alanine carboxypeptidase [Candidatus Moraniibacteriota bacterium]|nr:MAG: D-alanyl-D-alanine carboxypeptidase [Candidatus Moranbacteria bacterium]